MGGGVRKVPEKCHVLFECPLITRQQIYDSWEACSPYDSGYPNVGRTITQNISEGKFLIVNYLLVLQNKMWLRVCT